ncbi:putative asparagine synthetase AsnB [Rhizocola hellebori]|uniref:asparagine synthase (glutamine-hydrolyzing) n=1 Tax=Rhizocola hellebori TaxID=1392758 RepID=A0A8J3Q683_9ACTN|nr:putative asparagine synthetase AsnB [Rhizocola hellebori]
MHAACLAASAQEPAACDLTSRVRLLDHRGPDDLQTACLPGGICFGFARLAIIDRAGSAQPLTYPASGPQAGRWTLVYNGELYNYRELREELGREHGAVFATDGDAEVFAAVLNFWGPEGLHRLRGMFAYAAWDSHEKVLHAGRDPFGIKPLYYQVTSGGVWLASEGKALPGTDDRLDIEALSYYLTMQYVPEPYTLDMSVRRLGAGSRLVWRPGAQMEVIRYNRPAFRPQPGLALEQATRRIRDALRDSVRAHLVADVPVGAFLSSGIDSAAVVAFAREHHSDLTVFSAGFDISGYSEIELAEQTARHLGVRLVPTVVTEQDVLRELPRIIWHLDDPVADPALVPLYFLARNASRQVKVVLSGEGADELFAGYRIYREPFALAPVRRLPPYLQSGLRRLSAAMPEGVRGKSYLNRATTPIEARYYGNARIFDDEQKAALIGHLGLPASHRALTAAAYAEAADLDDATTMQYVDLQTWLPGDILTKADRMTMAHSLELRVPFLDQHVFAAAACLPPELKLPPGRAVTKYALRQALRHVVPPFVVDRPKLGFPTPTAHWLRGELGEWTREIFDSSGAGELLNLDYARRLLAAHRRRDADHARRLWTLLTFCLWHAVFVENRFGESIPPRSQESLHLPTH